MGWIIVGIIFAVILLLTLIRVTVIFDFKDDLILKIKLFVFPVVTVPSAKKKKPKKEKKPEKESEPDKDEKKEDEKPKKKLAIEDILEVVKLGVDSLGRPLRKILKRTVISHLALRIDCGSDDAAKTAISFGMMNIAVGNVLGWIDTFFTLKKLDEISVTPNFASEETTVDCYCEIRLVLAAALAFAFTFVGRAIKYYFTHNRTRAAIRNLV